MPRIFDNIETGLLPALRQHFRFRTLRFLRRLLQSSRLEIDRRFGFQLARADQEISVGSWWLYGAFPRTSCGSASAPELKTKPWTFVSSWRLECLGDHNTIAPVTRTSIGVLPIANANSRSQSKNPGSTKLHSEQEQSINHSGRLAFHRKPTNLI
jgi:hypothetical protein